MALPNIILEVNGLEYGGLKEFTVESSLDSLASSFRIRFTELWGNIETPWEILPHSNVRIFFENQVLIDGFVDSVSGSLDSIDRIAVGRSKVAQLIDNSPVPRPTQYTNISLFNLAVALSEPYGITVTNEVGQAALRRIPVVRIQTGKTVFNFLEEEARRQQVLLGHDDAGNMRIFRPAEQRAITDIVQGVNITNCQWVDNWSKRFKQYYVESQSGLELGLLDQTALRGIGRDESVQLNRLLRIKSDPVSYTHLTLPTNREV